MLIISRWTGYKEGSHCLPKIVSQVYIFFSVRFLFSLHQLGQRLPIERLEDKYTARERNVRIILSLVRKKK